MGHTIKRFEDT